MSDQQKNAPANPWLQPLKSNQLVRSEAPRRRTQPVGPYTPNTPDQNEAIYAARAAAARQQAQARVQAPQQPAGQQAPNAAPAQTLYASAPSPVQQALDQAAMQAHSARNPYHVQPQQPHTAPQNAAVFYQQATGVQQPEPRPAPSAQPAQPHRLPMNGYGAMPQRPAQPQVSDQPAASRQTPMIPESALMIDESALGTTTRRRRMVMREVQQAAMTETEPETSFPPKPQTAAVEQPTQPNEHPAADAAMEPLPQAAPQIQLQDKLFFPAASANGPDFDAQPVPQAPEQPIAAVAATATAGETDKTDITIEHEKPQQADEPAPAASDAVQATVEPADASDLSLENSLKGFSWYSTDPVEDDDLEDDCIDSSTMPMPATVSTLDIPKVKRGKRLLSVLLVLMIIAAALAGLWLSGYGERLINKAAQLVEHIKSPTEPTGQLMISPSYAGIPAKLTVSVTTDSAISDIKLINDQGNELAVQLTPTAQEDGTLWSCTFMVTEPYSGHLSTMLLFPDGSWRPGREKAYVELN